MESLVKVLGIKNIPDSTLTNLEKVNHSSSFYSPDLHNITRSIKNLAEKFSVHGQLEKSNQLLGILQNLKSLNTQSETWIEVIQCLLLLSSEPLKSVYTPKLSDTQKSTIVDCNISNEIFEGDHWKVPDRFDSDSDLSDWDEPVLANQQYSLDLNSTKLSPKLPDIEPLYKDDKNDQETFQIRQYWKQSLDLSNLETSNISPNGFNVGIIKRQSESPNTFYKPFSTTHFVTELDIIREILFMFNGVSTEIFKLELNQFKYIPKFSLTHITNGALKTMMKQFIDLANMIQHLNLFVLNCCHNSKFGNTLSRLGMIVHTLLLDFQNHIHQLQLILSNRADIEKYSCQSLTLLSLMNHFNVLLSDLVYMHDFLNSMVSFHWIEFKYRDGVKSNTVIVNDILMGFYNRIIQYPDTDMKSKSLVLKWFFYCLEPTLMIISRLISTGVLKDVHQEFFIQCGTDTDGSPLDWKTCGVLLKESCPIFFIPVSEALMNIYKCGLLIGIKYNETIHLESDVSIYLEKHEKGDDDEGIEVVDTIRDIEKKENISELTFESWMITPEPISFKTVQKDHLEFKNIHHFETFLEKLIHKLIQPYNLYFNQQLSNYLIKQHQIQNHIQQIQNLFLFLHPQLTHDIILLTKTKSNCKPFQLQQFFESTFRKQNIWDYYKSIDFRIIPNDQFKSNSKLITPFDVITIQLNFEWPLNQIFNIEIQTKYQRIYKLLIRNLISLQHLNNNQQSKKIFEILRLREWIITWCHYCMNIVILPLINQHDLVHQFITLDGFLQSHLNLLIEIENRLFLNNPRLLELLNSVWDMTANGMYDDQVLRLLNDALIYTDHNCL